MNARPVEIQTRIKSVFFELYSEYKVAEKSMPFVIMHFETNNNDQYEIKLQLDIRTIHFSPKLQAELWQEIRTHCKNAFTEAIQA